MITTFTTYLKESFAELKRVNWPTKKQVLHYTGLVVAISVAISVFLGGLDFLFGWIMNQFVF